MSFWWLPLLTFLLLVVTTLFALFPPKEDQTHRKFAYVAIVVAIGVALFVFSLVAAIDESSERKEAHKREQHLQESVDQARSELRKANGELGEIRRTVSQPGSAEDTISRVERLLGQKPTAQPTPNALYPIASGTADLVSGHVTVHDPHATPTSNIIVTGQDSGVFAGALHVDKKTNGSFDIDCDNGGANGKVFWVIYP